MRLGEFIKNIFSIKDYGETHKIMRLLGLKIKFPKSEYSKRKKESPYYYYKKNNIDITTLPPATGQLRDIQLANLALLKELDYVCKQNGLQYWLDGGTLLGAVRHKGFIPWDDDIDVSMMRNDYLKIIDIFNHWTRNKDLYANYVYLGFGQCIIKIMHKKTKLLFVDIFPCDYTKCENDYFSRINQSKLLKSYIKKFTNNKTLNSIEKVRSNISEFNKNILNTSDYETENITCGIDYKYIRPMLTQPYNIIFPLNTIIFENDELPCVNNSNEYLIGIYGKQYMNYPNKIGFGHSMYCSLTKEEKIIIKDLI